MDDSGDIDVERILEEVRERVRRRERAARATFDGTAPIEERQAVSDLAVLHGTANLHGVPLPTDRRLVGGIVVRLKRLLLRLLFPVLQRQVEYNEANARLVWYLKEHVDRLVRELDRARAARLPSDEGRDGR